MLMGKGKTHASGERRDSGKRTATAVLCSALALGCLAGGIYAYQTDNETAGNHFSIGNVSITAAEPRFPTVDEDEGTGKPGKDGVPDECELLIPFEEVSKDPYITNTGINDVVVFFKVTCPVETLTLINDDGTRTRETPAPLFWFKQDETPYTFHGDDWDDDWTELKGCPDNNQFVHCDGINEEGNGYTYIFGYKTRLKNGESTTKLFDKIQNKKYGSRTISANEVEQIKVESYAIQADDISRDGRLVDTKGTISDDDLVYIYETFVNQNEHVLGRGSWR